MSYSQANLKPPGLRKRKSTITDDELQRQKQSKMTAGDGPESIDSTATTEPADEIKPVDPAIIEPDKDNDSTVYPSMADMHAKMKLEQRRATEKLTSQGRRVLKETLVSERCTSCEVRILHAGICDGCRICTMCGQQRSLDGRCQECAKLRCEEWRDNVDQSPISQSTPTRLDSHPSQPDTINSTPERGKAEVSKLDCAASSLSTMPAAEESENDKDAVVMWKLVASSLSAMQAGYLLIDDDMWKLAARYMLQGQPLYRSERTLPGIDFIAFQNDNEPNGIKGAPLKQIERLLSGIPDADIVAYFILSYLPEEYHALLSCTTIFAEEHTPIWRDLVLFGEWSEEEKAAFASEFSRLVPGSWATIFVLQKWHGLLEVSQQGQFSYTKD
ncbi:hypothetical protein V497_00747 [Pseudogymnoascus sp. VKM F-4516 (FW-969)]|nr:hypothetical protein V497_00747 [Pseudogymnoascus sp. VKM F-4516 (FW-969)]